jgi:two-component system chemotaxis response regulator CheB
VTKPTSSEGLAAAVQQVRQELTAKIFSLAVLQPPHRLAAAPSPAALARRAVLLERVDILAIGTSTGGPNALMELLPALPADLPTPVVIVQHMPPVFTKFLAERLNSCAPMPVQEGVTGAVLQPGKVWIAPGDYHMTVERQGTVVKLSTNQDAPESFCRPAVDPMFRSVAKVYGRHALAVILTGMGSDGMQGARHIREREGQVLAQDEATSVVWGMPGQVVGAGLADAVLPLKSMAPEIVRRMAKGRGMTMPAGAGVTGRARREPSPEH